MNNNLIRKNLSVDGYLQVKLDSESASKDGFSDEAQLAEAARFLVGEGAGDGVDLRIKLKGLMGIGEIGDLEAFEVRKIAAF